MSTADCILVLIPYFRFQMTGLNIDTDHIIEMACLVTEEDLNIVAEASFSYRCVLYSLHYY